MGIARLFSACLFLACCGVAGAASADDSATPATVKTMSDTDIVLLAEGLAAVNSGIASADPQGYAGLCVLFSPLAIAESHGRASDWVMLGGFGGIAAYDASAYGKDYSRKQVFADNFVAWNLLYGAALITEHFDGDKARTDVQHLSINVTPGPQRGLRVAYRWTF